jgi:fructuronate reductase
VYTDDAVAALGGSWGICAVTQRSRSVVDQLQPQDGLFTVLERGNGGGSARVIGSVREVVSADTDADHVLARLADPAVRVVTLTVTEKGYRHDPVTRRLRRDDDGICRDVAGGQPRTVIGQLVRGLQRRMRADAGPLAVLSCDNLTDNGRTLRTLVADFVQLLPSAEQRALGPWIDEHVSFPSSVVDRIVPATTAGDRSDVERLIGLVDAGAVVAEPFRQWVIEDDFPAGRPAWDAAGATLTSDPRPYELIKLRMLNGAHSALAYLGALAGCETVADAMAHDAFAAVAHRLMELDVRPTVTAPDGFDVEAYERTVLRRFADPALRHRTAQVAVDGSQKLPQRLLPTLRARRSAGAEPRWVALAVAAWMRWVSTGRTDAGLRHAIDDPLADALATVLAGAVTPHEVVTRLLGVSAIFPDDLRADSATVGLLTDLLHRLATDGALATARALVDEPVRPA